MSDDLVKRLRDCANGLGSFKNDQGDFGLCDTAADRIEELEERLEKEMQELDAADRRAKRLQARIEELEAKLAMADKLASEFKNCLEVLTKEDGYVCCSGHQCGCYGASLHAQAIYYANEAIDDYHKTTGGKDE